MGGGGGGGEGVKWGWGGGEGGWGWKSNTCSQDPTLSRFPPPPARHPYGPKIRTSRGAKFLFYQHQLFFKKSTQRRLVKPSKDAAGSNSILSLCSWAYSPIDLASRIGGRSGYV